MNGPELLQISADGRFSTPDGPQSHSFDGRGVHSAGVRRLRYHSPNARFRNPGNRKVGFAALILVAAMLIPLFGCSVVDPAGSQSAYVDALYDIEEGSSVRLGRSGPALSFEEVLNDSRCPEDVDCIWQGNAEVKFALGGRSGGAFNLSIPGLVDVPYEDNETVAVGGYTFKLVELSPYPVLHREGPSPRYRAVLRIEERSGLPE